MKRILLLVACLSVALFGSCSNEYDDSQIKSDLEELAARIEAVQTAVTAINADLTTYQGLINALKGRTEDEALLCQNTLREEGDLFLDDTSLETLRLSIPMNLTITPNDGASLYRALLGIK